MPCANLRIVTLKFLILNAAIIVILKVYFLTKIQKTEKKSEGLRDNFGERSNMSKSFYFTNMHQSIIGGSMNSSSRYSEGRSSNAPMRPEEKSPIPFRKQELVVPHMIR